MHQPIPQVVTSPVGVSLDPSRVEACEPESAMTDPAPEIDVNEVRVRESDPKTFIGCAECARLREEAAGLAAALHEIWATTHDGETSETAFKALRKWVRS